MDLLCLYIIRHGFISPDNRLSRHPSTWTSFLDLAAMAATETIELVEVPLVAAADTTPERPQTSPHLDGTLREPCH